MPVCRFSVALAFAAFLTFVVIVSAHSQEPPAVPRPSLVGYAIHIQDVLEGLHYDPAERGALIVVVPPEPEASVWGALPFSSSRQTLAGLADAVSGKVWSCGRVTTIAPREMTVIRSRPGRADPLADVPPYEALKLLLGSLNDAQWRKVGAAGLTLDDLRPEQARLMRQVLPPPQPIQWIHPLPGEPNAFPRWEPDGAPFALDTSRLRLQIGKGVNAVWKSRGLQLSVGLSRERKAGEPVLHTVSSAPPVADGTSAFGARLVEKVPIRLKPQQIDFDSPALDAAVRLDRESVKTVGDALARAAQVTHLDIRADARLATLPLAMRVARTQQVRAGDLLQILAFALTGAYRRVGNGFLLTDDVEGIGARWQRLERWATAAQDTRDALLREAVANQQRADPLRYFAFPSDAVALPGSVNDVVEKAERQQAFKAPTFALDALPETFRHEVERARDYLQTARNRNNDSNEATRGAVSFDLSVRARWLLPDGTPVYGMTPGQSESLYLPQFLPTPRDSRADSLSYVPPPLFEKGPARRLVVLPEATAEETRQMMRAARARGFREFWIRQTVLGAATGPAGDDKRQGLKAAIAEGKRMGLPVWAAVFLWQSDDAGNDRTIEGLTGDEWADRIARESSAPPYRRTDAARYKGWQALPLTAGDEIEERQTSACQAIAALTDLAGLCLCAVAPPGYSEPAADSVHYAQSGGELGYTLEARRDFLNHSGFDPIDLTGPTPILSENRVGRTLPFFRWTDDAERQALILWNQVRNRRASSRLSRLYGRLKNRHPSLPLYLEDRLSSYLDITPAWFGSWEQADRLPYEAGVPESEKPTYVARIRLLRADWRVLDTAEHPRVTGGTSALTALVQSALSFIVPEKSVWQGFALDLSRCTPANARQGLELLPLEKSPALPYQKTTETAEPQGTGT